MDRYCTHSIRKSCGANREIVQKIYDHAMLYRSKASVVYSPLTIDPHVNIIHNPGIDLTELFSEYSLGDYAYFSYFMDGLYEFDMIIRVKGLGICDLYFNGKHQNLIPQTDGTFDANVTFRKGKNVLLVRVQAGSNGFSGYAVPILPRLRMFPAGYVYYTRVYTEADGFYKQSGISISRLYSKHELPPKPELNFIDWAFPVKPTQSNRKDFNFADLCSNIGNTAYVHTYVQGTLSIQHNSPLQIFCGSSAIYSSSSGSFEKEFSSLTSILIKSVHAKHAWGFSAVVDGCTALPFVEGANCPDLQWVWIGPFGRTTDTWNTPYAPEFSLQFEEPYHSISAGPIYWRFFRPNTYMRQYVNSAFFGQWFYASMVGHYGIKLAAEKLGATEFRDYYTASIGQMCHHRDYSVFDKHLTTWASYMPNSTLLNTLDAIGTIGLNVAEYYLTTGDIHAKYLLLLLADSLLHNIPRFPDGTFHRNTTMWTDDMYMCLPFLARLWAITGDEKYLKEISTQVTGFYSKMFMKDQGLFSHIFFLKDQCKNRIPWGRGNGWVLLALSEVLQIIPKECDCYETALQIYKQLAHGVLRYRDKVYGIWHQVVNNHSSYLETSGSAMFITGLALGVINGWLDKSNTPDIVAAWNALTDRCIDSEGNIYGICMGSDCSMDESYYLNLGTIVNDDHGVGIVLSAGVAVMNLLNE